MFETLLLTAIVIIWLPPTLAILIGVGAIIVALMPPAIVVFAIGTPAFIGMLRLHEFITLDQIDPYTVTDHIITIALFIPLVVMIIVLYTPIQKLPNNVIEICSDDKI